MPDHTDTSEFSSSDLEDLRGMRWELNDEIFHIPKGRPGDDGHVVDGGGEAYVVPLLDERNTCRWFLKIFRNSSNMARRRTRAEWLISQRMHEWVPELQAAPRYWIDTRDCGRPDGFSRDFSGYLAAPVPGRTWHAFKMDVTDSCQSISHECRQRWVAQFLRATAMLERRGIVHGDLSDNNVLVDPESGDLHLIDFDAFVAPNAPREIQRLTGQAGGTVGTADYMPVDLQQRFRAGETDVSPYSDRRGRDLLLLELLCFESGCPDEETPSYWGWRVVEERLETTELGTARRYFQRREILVLPEHQRIASQELAMAMRIALPPATARRSVSVAADVPAVQAVSSKSAERLRDALWSITMAQWILLGSSVQRLLMRQFAQDASQTSNTAWLSTWIVGLFIMAFGGWQTSRIAFGTEAPTLYQIGPLAIPFPAYETGIESTYVREIHVLIRLALGALLVGGSVLML